MREVTQDGIVSKQGRLFFYTGGELGVWGTRLKIRCIRPTDQPVVEVRRVKT